MDRATANKILTMLKGYYPRVYFENMDDDRAKFIVDDLMDSFGKYDNEIVVQAVKNYHLQKSNAPTVADIYSEIKIILTDRQPMMEAPIKRGNAVPNPNGRALREMLRQRAMMKDPKLDPHDWEWYKENYPERPNEKKMTVDELMKLI